MAWCAFLWLLSRGFFKQKMWYKDKKAADIQRKFQKYFFAGTCEKKGEGLYYNQRYIDGMYTMMYNSGT